MKKCFFNFFRIMSLHIMITINEIKAIIFIKFAHKPEYMAVTFSYISAISIFKKFVTIPEFNICKIIIIVIIQGMEKYVLVICKIICPVVITTMTIAKNYKF